MSELRIITNHHPREIVYYWELSESEQNNLYEYDGIEDSWFFRYKGLVYDIAEFMRFEHTDDFGDYWHGYASDSYFSGVLVHIDDQDTDHVVVGWYLS